MKGFGLSRSCAIAYLITRAIAGGAQAHLLQLLAGYRDQFKTCLLVGGRGPLIRDAESLGIECIPMPHLVREISPLQDMRAFADLSRVLSRIKPDLLHVHSSKAGVLGRLAAKKVGIPSVFTAHGWAFADGTPTRRKLLALPAERLMAGISHKIITVSHADHALALKYRIAPAQKMTVVHNGVPDIAAATATAARAGPPKVVMVARFTAQKDHATLIDAVARIAPPLQLVLVGEGPLMAAAQHRVERAGMAAHIHFTGLRTDIAAILAEADIFALCTHWEGLPLSIIEAMRAGLPVVATDVGGVRELVAGDNGILVRPGHVADWVAALNKLASNPELRDHYGTNARNRYLQQFTAELMLRRTAAVYEEVLADSARQ